MKPEQAFDAMFIAMLLARMRGGGVEGGLFDSGDTTFRDLLDRAVADASASRGEIGIAALVKPALEP
jgi:Rod binding domain-containing protein